MTKPINLTRVLVVTAKIRGTKVRILIDSGYLSNFVSSNFVEKAQLHTQAKGYQYTFYGINDQPVAENGGTMTKEIILILIDI
jgi:Aspartyl protease